MSTTRRARTIAAIPRLRGSQSRHPPDVMNTHPAHRVRTLCSKRSQSARARQAGDLQLPGLHLHLRQNPFGKIPAYQEDPAGPHAGEAAEAQTGDVAAHAPPDSPTGEMAGARRTRLLQLPRRADELSVTRGLPSRGR